MVDNDTINRTDFLGLKASKPGKKCPEGEVSCPKPNHKPSSNGCGTSGWKGKLVPEMPLWMIDFSSSCNSHDLCYSTCNSSRSKCDQAFLKDMLDACSTKFGKPSLKLPDLGDVGRPIFGGGIRFPKPKVPNLRLETCKKLAKTYYTAVNKAGSIAYNAAQDEACICCPGSCP